MPTVPQPLRARKSGWPAAPPRPAPVVDYPDRDAPPMTLEHWRTSLDVGQWLLHRYAQREDVCVAGELTMYWREGDDEKWVQPDVFVAFGSHRDWTRRVWKSWEEGKFADFILEVASRSTHRRDQTEKRAIYESQGVREYWQHDPTGEFLPARLLGHRLDKAGAYKPVPLKTKPDGTRYGKSKVLGLHLCLDNEGSLRLYDPATGEFLRKEHAEASAEKDRTIAEERRLRAEERRRHAEASADKDRRHAEERRALLAEIEALKRQRPNP